MKKIKEKCYLINTPINKDKFNVIKNEVFIKYKNLLERFKDA